MTDRQRPSGSPFEPTIGVQPGHAGRGPGDRLGNGAGVPGRRLPRRRRRPGAAALRDHSGRAGRVGCRTGRRRADAHVHHRVRRRSGGRRRPWGIARARADPPPRWSWWPDCWTLPGKWRSRPRRSSPDGVETGHGTSVTSECAADGRRGGGVRSQRPGRCAHPGPGRVRGRGVRGCADPRRWHPHRGAHPGGLPPRRLLGGAPDAGGLPLLPLTRLARSRRRAAPTRGGLRASAGGGRAAALYRSVEQTASHLGGDAAAYRRLVGPLVDWLDRIVAYVMGPMRGCLATLSPWPASPASARDRCSTPQGDSPPTRRVRCSQARSALHGAADSATDRCVRPAAHSDGARRGLAGRAGWQRGHYLRPGGEVRRLGGVCTPAAGSARSPSSRRRAAVLLDVTPRQFVSLAGPRLSRRAAAVGQVPAGTGGLQGGLGARWPGAMGRRGLPAHRDRPRRRHLRGSGAGRGRGPGGTPRGTVPSCSLPSRVSSIRRVRTGGATDAVGVLPRAERVRRRHGRAHGGADRTVVPGFRDRCLARTVRTAAAAESHNPNLLGADVTGGGHLAADRLPSGGSFGTLTGLLSTCVSLLGFDAPRGRRPRHVRVSAAEVALRETLPLLGGAGALRP